MIMRRSFTPLLMKPYAVVELSHKTVNMYGKIIFSWMCNCSTMKEILEYDGNIPIICRWTQELLAYSFSVLHQPYRMMIDVNSLTCRFRPQIATHCMIATIISQKDTALWPLAYDTITFKPSATSKLSPPTMPVTQKLILSSAFIASVSILHLTMDQSKPVQILTSSPILFALASTLSLLHSCV